MAIRYLKIILVFFVGLQALLYFADNIINWGSAVHHVSYVLGMEGHEIYSASLLPPVTHVALVTTVLLVILLGELLVGVLSVKGAWDLWKVRKAGADSFNAAKNYAILGTGMAMVVWFGGFIVLGGALFQMWQTQLGDASLDGSFVYTVTAGLILLIVNQPDS